MKRILPLVAVVLIAGCSAEHAPSGQSPSTAASPATSSTAAPAASTPPAPAPNPSTPEASGPCSDDDLTVSNGPLESANTLRHVVVSFKNTSSHPCTLVGYPGADLVTPAGGVLINVARKPAAAAHRLVLNPGDVANADIEAYAVDTSTGNACPRWGALVVTPPNGFVSHPLSVDVPICGATVSSVD
ncbi:DUF4232 domain-containing protein [Mycobacterium sp.]|uniref:DUF4232 domain-containing protein n=1 Tax=Mycobacterium sp. TaxID=1785 RepID=UPI002CD05B9A|nr:DUF4232 domain-containing protein [Mycobacterium sp.]HKP39498.1 DUF4232 domain-containing protein [Mycobacterium sp.]